MLKKQDSGSDEVIISLFCDPFAAVAAVRALTAMGVAEAEIDLIGFLGSRVPDWYPFLSGMGVSLSQAASYREEFEDGAVMLVVRVAQPKPKKSAMKVLKDYGGVLPEETCSPADRGNYETH